MPRKKTLAEREKELQELFATPEGRAQLQELAARYSAASDRPRLGKTSVITYIIVSEREKGLIE
jgi:hypothetical protein